MPKKTNNAFTSDYNYNYFEVVQNTIVASNVSNGINFGPQGINEFRETFTSNRYEALFVILDRNVKDVRKILVWKKPQDYIKVYSNIFLLKCIFIGKSMT